ncbi:hypothetical protein JOD82_002030 [Paenibacillus sp. 1182]|nr:hypothetical protein [Paenibacillus sp. 1182]
MIYKSKDDLAGKLTKDKTFMPINNKSFFYLCFINDSGSPDMLDINYFELIN